jgi:hypothetical protein
MSSSVAVSQPWMAKLACRSAAKKPSAPSAMCSCVQRCSDPSLSLRRRRRPASAVAPRQPTNATTPSSSPDADAAPRGREPKSQVASSMQANAAAPMITGSGERRKPDTSTVERALAFWPSTAPARRAASSSKYTLGSTRNTAPVGQFDTQAASECPAQRSHLEAICLDFFLPAASGAPASGRSAMVMLS